MKIKTLFEQENTSNQSSITNDEVKPATDYIDGENEYTISEIKRTDRVNLKIFTDLVNSNTGQLSWKLTPDRLLKKMGILGGIYGLFYRDQLVGGVTVKQVQLGDDVKGGEIGYLFVLPEHRSLPNVKQLYDASLENFRRFDVLFATTNVLNRPVNVLLKRTPKMKYLFTAQSPYSTNKLNYWLSIFSNKKYSMEEREQMVRSEYESENTD